MAEKKKPTKAQIEKMKSSEFSKGTMTKSVRKDYNTLMSKVRKKK